MSQNASNQNFQFVFKIYQIYALTDAVEENISNSLLINKIVNRQSLAVVQMYWMYSIFDLGKNIALGRMTHGKDIKGYRISHGNFLSLENIDVRKTIGNFVGTPPSLSNHLSSECQKRPNQQQNADSC